MIITPGTSSCASEFSLIGSHLPVPGTRPYTQVSVSMPHASCLENRPTKIVIRGLEDLCTTSRRETIMLTAMPTSTFHIIVKKNVNAMSDRSTHARILDEFS